MLIAEIVGEQYNALDNGRIRIYIPTLVEHGARTRLHQPLKNDSLDNLLTGSASNQRAVLTEGDGGWAAAVCCCPVRRPRA